MRDFLLRLDEIYDELEVNDRENREQQFMDQMQYLRGLTDIINEWISDLDNIRENFRPAVPSERASNNRQVIFMSSQQSRPLRPEAAGSSDHQSSSAA
jgi:hypothetical protein